MKPLLGCGFDERYRDNATATYDTGAKTCAEYYARTPYVRSVYEYLRAYRAGSTGSVFDLPHCLFEALQLLDAELQAVEADIQEQLLGDG